MLKAQLMPYVNKTVKVYLWNGEIRQGVLFCYDHFDMRKGWGKPRYFSVNVGYSGQFKTADVRSIELQ